MPTIVKVTLSSDAEAALKKHLKNRIRAMQDGLKTLHTQRLREWRMLREAQPKEKVREYPFHGASNLIVPIVAIFCDSLKSRFMAAVFKTRPLWYFRVLGTHKGAGEPMREALEEFMQYVAFEPTELDLYRVYSEFYDDVIAFGTGVIKCPHELSLEDWVVPAGDGLSPVTTEFTHTRRPKYEGPKPEKVQFENFLIPPSARTVEGADIKAHIQRMQRHEIEEREFMGVFDKKATELVLKTPDRAGPAPAQLQRQADADVRSPLDYDYAEWDVYECHCIYKVNNLRTRIIAWYHMGTDTLLRAVYQYYPDELFIAGRLLAREGVFHGIGFCEALGPMQEEISEVHNQRRDAMTVANAKVARVDPDSKLHEGYNIFPGALVPAAKDELEMMSFGEPSPMTMEEERLLLDLAERRTGVSPPQQGFGAGGPGKRGVYTAMGTLSLLQEGNNRSDLNISDARYAHTKLGRMLVRQYAEFGVGDRADLFGDKAKDIRAGLEAVKAGTIGLPIASTTASVNREVEKQNDIMLSGLMSRHYGMITQMLQAAANPLSPPNVKDYVSSTITAANNLMKIILRHFGFDEVERMVPEAKSEVRGTPGAQVGGAPMAGAAGGGSLQQMGGPEVLANLAVTSGRQ